MNPFEPRTFSTDWEVMVIDKLERCVSHDKLGGFAGMLRREFDIPVNIDWNTLEFALGINSSLSQIWERIRRVTDRAAQMLGEYDLDLFPAGAHPMEEMFNSSHIHVGTLRCEADGIRLENRMLRYAPCFAALAANSPFTQHRSGEYKSYRVYNEAHGCTSPSSVRDPQLAQATWGTDSGPKVYSAPTYEVRVTDCASSRRFLAELAVFVAAFVHHQAENLSDEIPTPEEYRDSMTNRYLAARDGLQATFLWRDGNSGTATACPVAEILEEMLDSCARELAALGATRADLSLIGTMLKKRVCQADYARRLGAKYADPYLLTSAYAKLMRHWDIIDAWVCGDAPILDPMPVPDEEAILSAHLALVGEGTHFYRSREAMRYPPVVADEIIERLIGRGDVVREETLRQGIVLSRVG
jgi:gamma-glutamyl:cysteine ligase YbdK (ATP-grasp superfamily)